MTSTSSSGPTPTTSRTAVVTGASRGIGAHIARALVDDGWAVAGLSRSGDAPEGITGIACDVTEPGNVNAAVAGALHSLGGIDLLVNNAGLVEPEVPLWEADPDRWWQVMVTNVRGPFLVSRAVIPHMIDAGGGRIVNLNSGAGTREDGDLTAYTASKSALARITGGIAAAGERHGVFAFDMAPGVVRTDMTESMEIHVGRTQWTDPADVTAMVLALASGELDAFSGRFVRVGADSPESLRAAAARGLDHDARTLRLRPWGDDDPMVARR